MASGSIDWGQVAGSSGGGGIQWHQVGTAPLIKAPQASSSGGGGGGILGGIENFIGSHGGHEVGSVLHGAADFGENSLRGFYNIGHATVRDIVNHPYSLSTGPLAPLTANLMSFAEGGHGGHLVRDVAEPIGEAYAHKYAPVFEHPLTGKSYRGIEKDPFGTALDAASLITAIPTGGESAILRGTTLGERLGAIGEGSRLSRIADRIEAARGPITRQVETVRGSGQMAPYTIDAARSPLGRAIQRNVTLPLREGPLAHVPGIGLAGQPLKNAREAKALSEAGTTHQLGQYERSLSQLSRAEHTAIHIAAEGDHSLPPSMWRQQRVDFYRKQLEDTVDAGARKDIERQLKTLGADSPKLAAKIDKALTNPRPAFLRAYERARDVSLRSSAAAGFKPETTAERALLPARQFREALGGVPRDVAPGDHPFGENFVFAHRGPQMPRSNAIGISKTTMPLGKIQRTIAQHTNQGIRLAAGRIFTSPSVITHDALSNLRWEAAHGFQDWLAQHARDIPEGGVPKGWVKFNPEGIRGQRALLERSAYGDQEEQQALNKAMSDMTGTTSEQRPMMVPERYAKAVEQEFQRSHAATRILVDRPMAVWRAAVLKYRPAWLVNNIVGQHMLYFLHAGGPSALIRYMQMLRVEKGEGYAQNALLQALRVPSIRLKYLHMLDETGAHGVRVGTTEGILGGSERFMASRRGQLKEARPVPYAFAAAIPRSIKAIGDANAKLNQLLADDIPRSAKFVTEARRLGAVRRIQRVGREMNESVGFFRRLAGPSTEQILRGLTDDERVQILHKVNAALGDFNSLSPFERNKIRRIMPFYAWFKVIGAITKDLVVHHPEKVNLLRNLEVAAQQNPGLMPQGKLPSWLQGAIATAPAHNGIQEMLSAVGLNPFATPVQIGQAAAAPFTSGGNAGDALGLLGPGFQLYDLFQGHDPLSGGDYTGAGAKLPPALRAIVGEGASLPQVRLLQGLGYLPGYKPAKTYQSNKADLIYQYLGVPRRHVKLAQAHQYANEGL